MTERRSTTMRFSPEARRALDRIMGQCCRRSMSDMIETIVREEAQELGLWDRKRRRLTAVPKEASHGK